MIDFWVKFHVIEHLCLIFCGIIGTVKQENVLSSCEPLVMDLLRKILSRLVSELLKLHVCESEISTITHTPFHQAME